MKINPRIAVAAVVATGAIVGGGIAAFTAMSPGHPAGTVEAAPINAGDGQQAFRAIVFGQGNYAKALGEKTDMAPFYASGYASHNTAASVAAADRIIDDIASSDPRYFTNFDQQVRSGNPFTVAAAIGGISERLRHSGVVSARDDAEPPGWYSNFHINQNVYVNINVGVNENVGVNVNAFKAAGVVSSASGDFSREHMIADIVTVFDQAV